MSTFVELEIQNLLNETLDLEDVATRLIQSLESSPDPFSSENILALARFLIASGKYHKLAEYIFKNLDNENFKIPWPYFMEALAHSALDLDEALIKALTEGILETRSEGFAARSQALNQFIPELGDWRSNRNYKIHKDYLNNKKLLLDQLVTLRTQQLYEQEKELLQRLQKLYPGDKEVAREASEHKQRHALEILTRHSPRGTQIKTEDLSPRDPELEMILKTVLDSLLEHAAADPDMAFDFAIAAFMLEGFEEALEILNYSEQTESYLWLRLEILLRCRRFVELLAEIAQVEILLSQDPETFFATAYLRAQALWGLGQRHTAIEVMESLLAARPHYRAASALLNIWSAP